MPSPFPGMDPFLERPDLWADVHHGLVSAIRDYLAPLLRPKYRVAIEKRTYLGEAEGVEVVARPDVSVYTTESTGSPKPLASKSSVTASVIVTLPVVEEHREAFLEIRRAGSEELVTSLEVLSPANKRPGKGRRLYETKRRQVLASPTHLVEVDLLRGGAPMPLASNQPVSTYRILVSRSHERPQAQLFLCTLQDPLPQFTVPLDASDQEPTVNLTQLLHDLYDRAGYDLAVDYSAELTPPPSQTESEWLRELLKNHGPRR